MNYEICSPEMDVAILLPTEKLDSLHLEAYQENQQLLTNLDLPVPNFLQP